MFSSNGFISFSSASHAKDSNGLEGKQFYLLETILWQLLCVTAHRQAWNVPEDLTFMMNKVVNHLLNLCLGKMKEVFPGTGSHDLTLLQLLAVIRESFALSVPYQSYTRLMLIS